MGRLDVLEILVKLEHEAELLLEDGKQKMAMAQGALNAINIIREQLATEEVVVDRTSVTSVKEVVDESSGK